MATDLNNKAVKSTMLFWLLLLSLVLTILVESVLNLTPPISRDAIIHHLAIPKLWIQNNGFYETPWADFSYYPMNINLLYLIPLMLKNDVLPKFIHMAFGFGTGWLIFSYLKRKYDASWGMLGFVLFITTPIIIWLSTSAYIDLGMTFFTTASILSFIRWRESGYDKNMWFILAACSMGLAVGSKYNALIAWFITNLLIVIIHVRDEESQPAAIKYGVLFFIVTAAVASPWYIKNYILTGNPFYPLFNSFFASLYSDAPVAEIIKQGAEKSTKGSMGFFQLRAYMYGESFWETLAIPVRMFFQGEDNSYQYFQGRLNPILIVFLPFVFLKNKDRKNNLLFLIFSMFFMVMAFFLTAKQIRYQLPVLPFLTILTIVGVKNLADGINRRGIDGAIPGRKLFRNVLNSVLLLSVGLLLIPNMRYLYERFDKVKPVAYLLKQESKEDFLRRHLLHYDAAQFVNANIPKNAVVFTVYFGRRGYHMERPYFNSPQFGTSELKKWVKYSANEERFLEEIRSFNATHVAMRTDLAEKFLANNFSQAEVARFVSLIKKHWRLLYSKNGYSVWDIKAQ